MDNLQHFEKEIIVDSETIIIRNNRIETQEYIEFLKRTDLGKQYPKEDFLNRITSLLKNTQISLIARNAENRIVGICFGLTDFAYWLFITDLGIDTTYTKKGLGKLLLDLTHNLAGGEKNIIQYLCAHDDAIPFYYKTGMTEATDVMVKDNINWTSFEVKKEFN